MVMLWRLFATMLLVFGAQAQVTLELGERTSDVVRADNVTADDALKYYGRQGSALGR